MICYYKSRSSFIILRYKTYSLSKKTLIKWAVAVVKEPMLVCLEKRLTTTKFWSMLSLRRWPSCSSNISIHGSTRSLTWRQAPQMANKISQLLQMPQTILSSLSWQLKLMRLKKDYLTLRILIWTANSHKPRQSSFWNKWLERTPSMMIVYSFGMLQWPASMRKLKPTSHSMTSRDRKKSCVHGAPLPRQLKRCCPSCQLKRGLQLRECWQVTWQACLKAEWMEELQKMLQFEWTVSAHLHLFSSLNVWWITISNKIINRQVWRHPTRNDLAKKISIQI